MRSKYGAIKTVVDGINFASRKEAQRYKELKLLEKAGKISKLELQPRFELIPKPNKIVYVADFLVEWSNGEKELIEVKGFETTEWKLKKKLFNHFYPGWKLTIEK